MAALVWAGIKFSFMPNPYKPEDKVITKIKGVEVEGAVRLVWNDEVQVRTSDGVLLWRTVKTVRPLAAMGAELTPTVAPAAPESAPVGVPAEPVAGMAEAAEPVAPASKPEPVNVMEAATSTAEQAESASTPAAEPSPEHAAPSLVPETSNAGGCGTAEEIVKQRRRRRR